MEKSWAIIISQNGLGEDAESSDVVRLLSILDGLDGIEHPPVKLYFTTEGVALVAAGSPLLPRLKKLEADGVEMVACRSCLDYLGLRDCVEVGRVGAVEQMMTQADCSENVVLL